MQRLITPAGLPGLEVQAAAELGQPLLPVAEPQDKVMLVEQEVLLLLAMALAAVVGQVLLVLPVLVLLAVMAAQERKPRLLQ